MVNIITKELRTIWITPDGFKFFSKEEAQLHCEEFNLLETNNEEGENDAEEI